MLKYALSFDLPNIQYISPDDDTHYRRLKT